VDGGYQVHHREHRGIKDGKFSFSGEVLSLAEGHNNLANLTGAVIFHGVSTFSGGFCSFLLLPAYNECVTVPSP